MLADHEFAWEFCIFFPKSQYSVAYTSIRLRYGFFFMEMRGFLRMTGGNINTCTLNTAFVYKSLIDYLGGVGIVIVELYH